MYNWIKCIEGKFQYTRLKVSESDEVTEADKQAFEVIYDDYISKVGISPIYAQILKLQVSKAKAQADYMIKNDRKSLNVIRINEVKEEELKKQLGKGMSIEKVLIHLSKWYGGNSLLKSKDLTVQQYLDLLEEFETSNKVA